MTQLPPLTDADFMRGNRSAPLILIHYGDFECPYSGAIHPVILAMQKHFCDDLCVVFRLFPLPDLHPHALKAALAAQAAGENFWDMHDLLFTHQDALEKADFRAYATKIGLDEAQFERDFHASETMQAIADSVEGGHRAGAHGTPSLFINGVFHDNNEELWDEDALREVLETARRSA